MLEAGKNVDMLFYILKKRDTSSVYGEIEAKRETQCLQLALLRHWRIFLMLITDNRDMSETVFAFSEVSPKVRY